MKTRPCLLFIAFFAFISVYSLVSCAQKKSQTPGNPELELPDLSTEGTADTGGGTGFLHKVFESYIVDPTKLSAYKIYLKPLLDNITNAETNESARLDVFFGMKTWYVAPVRLNKISKSALGITFIRTKTQQIAIQSRRSIWVDADIFNKKMSPKAQADVLAHELIMTMYLIKFMSFKEMCRLQVMGGITSGNDEEK